MASKEEFRAYMNAATGEIEGRPRPCPDEAQLVIYQNGGGDDDSREAIASHLTICAACRETLLDIQRFLDPVREGESAGLDLDREWRRFNAANMPKPSRGDARRTWFQFPTLAWGSALSVVILSGLSWFWMQARFRAELAAMQQQAAALQGENRALRASRDNELAAVTRPRLDSAIVDLYPQASLDRSGRSGKPRTRLAGSTPAVLILNGAGQPKFPAYAIGIQDAQSRQVWQGDELRRHADGSYAISLPAGFLPAGDYALVVFGISNKARVKLAEYQIAIGDR